MSVAKMSEFFHKILDFIQQTKVLEQIKDVNAVGLGTNLWFMVPFVAFILYLLFKKKIKDIIIIAILCGVWWVSGTEYMHTLIVGGIVQIDKILPVLIGGAVALGIVIYLLFGRSD
jgi:ascorbate-specific PTS system EIIC-type component UlaA